MNRRDFLGLAGACALTASSEAASRESMPTESAAPAVPPATPLPIKLGIDLFSLRAQKWSPLDALDYCAQRKVQVVHFSEIRFLGGIDIGNLQRVNRRAKELGLEVEIGMMSICPSSKMFDPSQGTAEEQLSQMLQAATTVGSKIVRCVLGSSDDRKTAPIQKHIDDTVAVLQKVKSKAIDYGVKIAIENHAGDMQSWELKNLVEAAGPEFVGVCLDAGNPLWVLEDPHVALDTLHPYVLTSHVRDSAIWNTPHGAAVTWVEMGQGNVDIGWWAKKFVALCPGKALSMESILFGPRAVPYREPAFWNDYRDIPAWEFERYVQLAEKGVPGPTEPWTTEDEAERERKALDASLNWTKQLLGIAV